jgi:PAS domain S-box-containing protein
VTGTAPQHATDSPTGRAVDGSPTGATALPAPEPVDVLLVDDRAENLLALEAILEPLGQRMVRAHSGEEALRQLLTRDFAVILLDVQMPGMNGFETARMIKARERSKYIPIIFLTAISKSEEYVFQGYSVGAVDYMAKPFQPDILRSKVAVFVELYQKQRQLQRQEQMLRERERAELELSHMRELWESEARFGDIVRSALDAIVVFGADGVVRTFNAAAERMFGVDADQAIGSPVSRFFPVGDATGAVARLRGVADGQPDCPTPGAGTPSKVVSLSAHRADGEEFPMEASISCLDTRGGRVYTLIARDVSDRRSAEEALRRQAISLEQSSRELQSLNEELSQRQDALERAMTARSRFYASMSHELRTPINAILGYSTLILENIYGPLNEKQTEGIQRTHKAAKHLLELVNDVLDLSKIEAGKIDLRLQPVSFPTLIEDLFVTVRPLADEHGSQLTLHAEGPPVRITSDPRRVRQILLNLLSNAIKFGRGKPIDVRCVRRDDAGVTIDVADQGPGIAPEDQERIFQEFVQLGKTQLQEGTGLGLPISRRLAEMLQGTLTVESRPGEGSVFRLSLPPTADTRGGERDDEESTDGGRGEMEREDAVDAGDNATDAKRSAGGRRGARGAPAEGGDAKAGSPRRMAG